MGEAVAANVGLNFVMTAPFGNLLSAQTLRK